ncbi:acyltransferase family protein [Alteromonas stellipolaris]|uniref:acyltransferase family protein n=1 Tax=Alteromonas stellipolaris TaxID=233316 RepID=UPI00273304C4|nr:acyltransferase family protein [Alteromonas stellipolaris]MDP2537140.1 acyltransferase family protein [Alteromonas stellipolaris]
MFYRKDIDGLRALAVLGVVVFHLGDSPIPGGFSGVDIFFVISGFLITSILLRELKNEEFSFLEFYERRIYRLFPALFAVMASTLLVGYLLFMPDEFLELGQSIAATSVYLSNFFFFLKSDYFSGPSELKPLLHTWSLAVEEQFYIVFPLMLFLLRRCSIFLLGTVIGISCLLLLTTSQIAISDNASAIFYLAPFRFWELLTGSLIAIVLPRINNSQLKTSRNILSVIGFFLIICSFFMLNESVQFPGVTALPAVLGTGLLIFATQEGIVNRTLLSNSTIVWFGKISYSMYLWHWPLVVFYGYYVIRPVTFFEKVALFILTTLLAWLSWKYIENPFRRLPRTGKGLKRSIYLLPPALLSVMFIGLGVLIHLNHGFPDRFDENILAKYAVVKDDNGKAAGCFMRQDKYYQEWEENKCIFTIPNTEKIIMLWGDSHALHLFKGLSKRQNALHANLLVYTSAGCSPFLNVEIRENPQCKENNQYALKVIEKYRINEVILAGNWAWAFKKKDDGFKFEELKQTVDALENLGIKVWVVNQLPLYSVSNPQFLAYRLDASEYDKPNYYLKPYYGEAAASNISSILDTKVIDVFSLMCPAHGCTIYRDNELMVVDEGHLSAAGSDLVSEFIIDSINH